MWRLIEVRYLLEEIGYCNGKHHELLRALRTLLLVEIAKEISSVTTRPVIVAYLEPCQTYKTEGLTRIVKSASMSSEKSYWCKWQKSRA